MILRRPIPTLNCAFTLAPIFVFALSCRTGGHSAPTLSESPDKVLPFYVHAHRGGRNEGVENSSAQMIKAIDEGADAIEFDVVGSRDGDLVVKHDQFVERANCAYERSDGRTLKSERVYVRTLLLKDITALTCTNPQRKTIYQIETLNDVLEKIAQHLQLMPASKLKLNIETKISEVLDPDQAKDPNYEVVNDVRVHAEVFRLIESLRAHGLESRAIIQSFDIRSLQEARNIAPNIPRSRLLLPTGAKFYTTAHLLAWVEQELKQTDEDRSQRVPLLYTIVSPRDGQKRKWVSYVARVPTPYVAQLIDAASVKTLKAQGLQVIPWTINDPADWRRLKDYGVDAMITDEPAKLLAWRKQFEQ